MRPPSTRDTGRVREEFSCPACGAQLAKDRLERRTTSQRTFAGDFIERIEFRPVRIAWRAGSSTGQKLVDEHDQAVLQKVGRQIVSGFPSAELPLGDMVHGTRLGPKGFKRAHHLWPDRALVSLAVLWSWAKEESHPATALALRFWIEQAFWGLSWMNRFKGFPFGKLGGSQVNQQMSGVYYVPALHAECSIRYNLVGSQPSRGKREALVKLWSEGMWRPGSVAITTGSSTSLPIPEASVDYVFVDPPFGQNIPYSDLALVVEQGGVRNPV
jgi:hypothetical protein